MFGRLKKVIQEICIQMWISTYKNTDKEYLEFLSAIVVEGYLSVFRRWIATGMNRTPEEMASFAQNIVQNGIGVLGHCNYKT